MRHLCMNPRPRQSCHGRAEQRRETAKYKEKLCLVFTASLLQVNAIARSESKNLRTCQMRRRRGGGMKITPSWRRDGAGDAEAPSPSSPPPPLSTGRSGSRRRCVLRRVVGNFSTSREMLFQSRAEWAGSGGFGPGSVPRRV